MAIFLAFLALVLRVRDRLLTPQVWAEDGVINLPDFFDGGLTSLIQPVNGYLLLVPKLITALSASISVHQYPLLSTALAWLMIIGVIYVIATAPTHLVNGIWLATASLLVPTDPEVFGLSLYTFWWVSLLLFLLVFWDEERKDLVWRSVLIFFGALSSPVILAILPLFWFRAWMFRKNTVEIWLAGWATLWASVQLGVMLHSDVLGSRHSDLSLSTAVLIVQKFLGAYAIGNLAPELQWIFGLAILLLLMLSLFRYRRSWVLWSLAYLWLAAVYMTIARVDIEIIHPELAGPRYFFYPFILLSWALLQIAFTERSRWIKVSAWSVLILALINTLPVLDRTHDDLHWQRHLESCQQFDHYMLPVQYDGTAAKTWNLPMTGQLCNELLEKDWLYRDGNRATFPYRIIGKFSEVAEVRDIATTDAVVKNNWHETDDFPPVADSPSLNKYHVFSSNGDSPDGAGELIINLHHGQQIWFRSEIQSNDQRIVIEADNKMYAETLPTVSDWTLLEFSNKSLPNKFTIRFIDGGGSDEWLAIALRTAQ